MVMKNIVLLMKQTRQYFSWRDMRVRLTENFTINVRQALHVFVYKLLALCTK